MILRRSNIVRVAAACLLLGVAGFRPGDLQTPSDTWITVSPFMAEMLPHPQQELTHTFTHQVTYQTTEVDLDLGLEIQGDGIAFEDVQIQVEHVNFENVSGGGSPGSSTGPQTYSSTAGPYTVLTGISNVQATANFRFTITLASPYALSGDRTVLVLYTLE